MQLKLVLSILAILAAGCGTASSSTTATLPTPSPIIQYVTPTPIPTSTPAPTPTPHPLAITTMREGEYPGSEIIIEETLEPGSNYKRYRCLVPIRGLDNLRADDDSQQRETENRFPGHRIQSWLHSARAISNDRTLRRLRRWLCAQWVYRVPSRLSRTRRIGWCPNWRVRLAGLHHRCVERSRLDQASHRCRPQSHWHVGAFNGRAHYVARDGDDEGHQSRRDLGGRRRLVRRYDVQLAPTNE